MIRISRAEVDEVRARIPKTYIVRTNKQAPARKATYYMEESKAAMKIIRRLRNQGGQ